MDIVCLVEKGEHASSPDAAVSGIKHGMASVKELQAAQRFLRGVRALSTYEATRDKQFVQVEKVLKKAPALTAAQAAAWIGALEAGIWTDSQVECFQEAVAEKTRELVVEHAKQAVQDYTLLPYHLPEELWAEVEGGGVERDAVLRRLCMHAGRMGLRYGSEATKATLVALAHWPRLREGVPAIEQHELYIRQKAKVCKHLTLPPPEIYLLELPMHASGVPVELRVFGGETARPALAHEVTQFVRQMPLRKDHRSLQEQGPRGVAHAASPTQGGKYVPVAAVCQVVEACARTLCTDAQLPARAPLALCDGRVEDASQERAAAETPGSRERTPRGEDTTLEPPARACVEEDLAALRGDLPGEEPEAEERNLVAEAKAKAKGRAAAKAKGKAKSKAKAAPKERVLKRPARSQDAAGEAGEDASSARQARREAVLRLVPLHLKKQFEGGCSTCRYRPGCTISCWAKRGFAL